MSDSDKFPTDFVPVSRPLVEELGYQAAYIFGIVWNYCQMENGICNASHDTIASRAGMSRRSVIDYIGKLIKAGYIEDLTPDIRNAPHHLCAKKGVQILHSKERTIKEEKPVEEPERCENPAQQNGTGMQELHSGYAESAQEETESREETPNGVGGNIPPGNPAEQENGIGPRRQLMNEFLTCSGLKLPFRKKDQGFWWSSIGEIYELFGRDVDVGKKMIRQTIDELRRDKMRVSGPESLIKTARDLSAQKNHKPRISIK